MAGKRKAEHRSVSDTCWLAVERANDAEHRATRRTVNPSAGSMIEQRGNTHSSEQCVIKGLGPFQIVGADGCIAQHLFLLLWRSEGHTSELQSLMRISYAVFCLQQKNKM